MYIAFYACIAIHTMVAEIVWKIGNNADVWREKIKKKRPTCLVLIATGCFAKLDLRQVSREEFNKVSECT